MQKQEIINAILTLTRQKPRMTNKELSLDLKLHRNTISKYRKFIRQNYYKTPQEIVNKIDSRLDEELEAMSQSTNHITNSMPFIKDGINGVTEPHSLVWDQAKQYVV